MVRKAIIKGSVFVVILIFTVSILNSIFVIKSDHRSKLLQGLYNHAGDYDVVLMGSSHMNGGIDPNVLWNQYGITSFNYATGGQPIDVTYYLLKEVMKQHKNAIVVVDMYYLGLTDQYGQEGYIRNALDNMKFSINKVDAIMNCVPAKDRINYLVPIFKYHYRWDDLSYIDYYYDSSNNYYAKGFDAGVNKYGKDDTTNNLSTGTADIPAKTMEYLNKIIDLSKKDGFKLIFTNMPYDYNSTTEETDWVANPSGMTNKVAEIAKKNNIPFVDYCKRMDEINFDFKNDMNNISHTNLWGAYKVSTDFGKFLSTNYKLVDHRNDKNYSQWSADYLNSQVAQILKQK